MSLQAQKMGSDFQGFDVIAVMKGLVDEGSATVPSLHSSVPAHSPLLASPSWSVLAEDKDQATVYQFHFPRGKPKTEKLKLYWGCVRGDSDGTVSTSWNQSGWPTPLIPLATSVFNKITYIVVNQEASHTFQWSYLALGEYCSAYLPRQGLPVPMRVTRGHFTAYPPNLVEDTK